MARDTLQAGKLRHVVEIFAPEQPANPFTSAPGAGTTIATVRASVEAMVGRELYAAQQITAQVTHKITIRKPAAAILSRYRVRFDGHTFQIEHIKPDTKWAKFLELMCVERNDG